MNLYRGCTHGCIYCDSRSICYHIDRPQAEAEKMHDRHRLHERPLYAPGRKTPVHPESP